MDKSGAYSYIYAKTSGILGKSFVGPKVEKLFEFKKLADLWTILFNKPVPLLPEVLLAGAIEKEAFNNFLTQYSKILNLFDKPDEILKTQLAIYEVENLKEISAALCAEEKTCPPLNDIGPFATIRKEYWPDLQKITKNTEYSWYKVAPSIHQQQLMEYRLDEQFIRKVWMSAQKVKGEGKKALIEFVREDYSLRNIIWALRLKVNYQFTKEEIMNELFYVTESANLEDPIANGVLRIIDKQIDVYEDWFDWKYKSCLNPHVDGEVWCVSPSWIEKKARLMMNKKAMTLFHQYPLSTASIFAWSEIKQYELTSIRTAVESIRLNINSDEAMKTVAVL